MLLFYVRHGDPIYSPDGLTEQGKAQAEALKYRFKKYGLDEIYSSTSNRAYLTAKPTADYLGKDVTMLEWCHEGLCWKELTVEKDGERQWLFHNAEWVKKMNEEIIKNGGERWYDAPDFKDHSFKNCIMRIERETDEFLASFGYVHNRQGKFYSAAKRNEKRVALFAHQGFGLAFLSAVLDVPYPVMCTRFDLGHSSVTTIDFTEEGEFIIPKVLQLANDSHLYKENLPTKYNNRIEF